jgi:hypothetical protein
MVTEKEVESLGWEKNGVGYDMSGYSLVLGNGFIAINSLAAGRYSGKCATVEDLKRIMQLLKIVPNGKQ